MADRIGTFESVLGAPGARQTPGKWQLRYPSTSWIVCGGFVRLTVAQRPDNTR